MPGLFGVDTPQKLYARLCRALVAFAEQPSEDGVFDVIFPLCHLREWIYPADHKTYAAVPEAERSAEQALHARLYGLEAYQVVLALCNNAKHFELRKAALAMEMLEGLRAGYGRAGDSLGVTHFVVDGVEVRTHFDAVAAEYRAYFEAVAAKSG